MENKQYVSPQMEVVNFDLRNQVLSGSETNVSIPTSVDDYPFGGTQNWG